MTTPGVMKGPKESGININVPTYAYLGATLQRMDGTPPRYACFVGGVTAQRIVKTIAGADRYQPEWQGLIDIVKLTKEGEGVLVLTNSLVLCRQFSGRYQVTYPKLKTLKETAAEIIQERRLDVCMSWVPPHWNLALRLLELEPYRFPEVTHDRLAKRL